MDRASSLRELDALAQEPFLLFLEPLDARILNQAALFSLMPSPRPRSMSGCAIIPISLAPSPFLPS